MSYREINQLVAILRKLGYTSPVGIDSFESPNFGQMASILKFLAQQFDPDISVFADISTELGRVEFIKGFVSQTYLRSGIRLNPKKLYISDKHAVRELMKLAGPIYKGFSIQASGQQPSQNINRDLVMKISKLSSVVPRKAVDLFDMLDKELSIRDNRTKILAAVPPLEEVEKSVNQALKDASVRGSVLAKEIERLDADEKNLLVKLKQKKSELDRTSKRLTSVQTVRPAYMDEYEGYEEELSRLFLIYGQLYKNIDYMEHTLEEIDENKREYTDQLTKEFQKSVKKITKRELDNIKNSVPISNSGRQKPASPALPFVQNDHNYPEDDEEDADTDQHFQPYEEQEESLGF